MNDTADGYRTDIDYTYSYHSELNPLRLRLAFLNAGLPMPAVATACELGFGHRPGAAADRQAQRPSDRQRPHRG